MLQIHLYYLMVTNVCNKNLSICFVLSKTLTKWKEDNIMLIKQIMKIHALQSFLFSVVGNCAKQDMLCSLASESVYRRQE